MVTLSLYHFTQVDCRKKNEAPQEELKVDPKDLVKLHKAPKFCIVKKLADFCKIEDLDPVGSIWFFLIRPTLWKYNIIQYIYIIYINIIILEQICFKDICLDS